VQEKWPFEVHTEEDFSGMHECFIPRIRSHWAQRELRGVLEDLLGEETKQEEAAEEPA